MAPGMLRVACFASYCLLAACGDGGSTVGASRGGSSGSAGAGGFATGGVGGNAGGSTAGGSSGVAGSGGSIPVGSCGPFGAPVLVFTSPNVLSSVSITGDELELFYYLGTSALVRKRASAAEPFAEGVEVPELSAVCAASTTGPAFDITEDGLRMYIDCEDGPTPLFLATRSDRSSPFSVGAEPVGTTETSINVSADELTVYTVTTETQNWQAKMAVRASTAEPFGAEVPLPGITVPFRQAEISRDGLSLFGIVERDDGNFVPPQWRLAVATRQAPSGPFSAPTTSGLPDPTITATIRSDYTPTLNGSCTALYFMRLSNPPDIETAIYVVRRQ
jgi:hypothetical protein